MITDPIEKLVGQLTRLPGIGEKTATRLAYFILRTNARYANDLAQSILDAKQKIVLCRQCFTFTDQDPCRVCTQTERNRSVLCVVERPSDVFAIEQTGVFHGLYHVLHGVLSPLNGVKPSDLKISELIDRVKSQPTGELKEVIFALNPGMESEATCLYVAKLLRIFPIRIARLAHGLPAGGVLEYSDRSTIALAVQNRVELSL